MSFWRRPFFQLLAVFFSLGLFAWWTFHIVSLPPSVRNLFTEDQAIVAAATPLTPEEEWQKAVAKLPPGPQNHPPEVTALLDRLDRLPPTPYVLANALARDKATPPGQTPPPWTGQELSALQETQQAILDAWEPFFLGPPPDWPRYPDSVLLFRSTGLLLDRNPEMKELLTYRPGGNPRLLDPPRPEETPELMFPLLRQCRGLGAIRFGTLPWEFSDTVNTADLTVTGIIRLVSTPGITRPWLESLRAGLAPAPTMSDLRVGLAADQALFARAADYLEGLPPATSAPAGLVRYFQNEENARWYLQGAGNPKSAAQLAGQFRRYAEQLEVLRQKTFLAGPAWRQWLSGDPGQGLDPFLAQGLGGFRAFENVRMNYLVALAVLDARIAWEAGDLSAARRIPDPAQPGAFLQVVEKPEGVRITSAHVPFGETNPVFWQIPTGAEIGP